jgi:hypothetical protein
MMQQFRKILCRQVCYTVSLLPALGRLVDSLVDTPNDRHSDIFQLA